MGRPGAFGDSAALREESERSGWEWVAGVGASMGCAALGAGISACAGSAVTGSLRGSLAGAFPLARGTLLASRLPGAAGLRLAGTSAGAGRSRTAAAPAAVGLLEAHGRNAVDLDARDRLADHLLDRRDEATIAFAGQGEGMTLAARPAGAADAVDVVLGMDRARRN